MSTIIREQPATNRIDDSRGERAMGGHQQLALAAVRADRADARWSVRVVLDQDAATNAIASLRAIIFDRDAATAVFHAVWSDWHDIPLLITHVSVAPLAAPMAEASATGLAEALLALLGDDAAACLAALHAADTPPPAPDASRRARQYRHIVRDAAWHDHTVAGRPDRASTAERTDSVEAEAAQRTLTGLVSGQADRARGDS
jgi:hypothetical protein